MTEACESIDSDREGLDPVAHYAPTRLEEFLRSRALKPAHVARAARYSRQSLLRVRMGRMEPTRPCIAAIVTAVRRLSGERVRASELFDLGEDAPAFHPNTDPVAALFYRVLSRLGAPMDFLVASLRPAHSQAMVDLTLQRLSRVRVKGLIERWVINKKAEVTTSHAVTWMIDQLRARIVEVNREAFDS